MARLLMALVLLLTACAGPAEDEAYEGRGPITFADGLDSSPGGQIKALVKRWNDTRGFDEKVQLAQMSPSTDAHRAQLTARAQDLAGVQGYGSQCYDVVSVDVVWTAAFAQAGYLEPLRTADFPIDSLLPKMVDASRYDERLWAIPWRADAGLLYYRKDVLEKEKRDPPKDWDELEEMARTIAPRHDLAGYIGQFARYEGLTVNMAEAIWAHGGDPLHPDTPEAKAGVRRLASGVAGGWIPQEALDYQETGSRDAFKAGEALFMRHWPNAWPVLTAPDSPVAGKVGVTKLPGASALGGWNLAVSRCSANQKTARDFIRFLIGEDNQRTLFREAGYPPTLSALYREPEPADLRDSVEGALPRPQSPYYDQLTSVMQEYLHNALKNPPSADESMNRLAEKVDKASGGR